MSWAEINSFGAVVRPFDGTPPRSAHRYSQFRATMTTTVERLATELRALQAKQVVVELDLRDRDIRADGFPRADARPNSPAVRLSFESKWGPLRYDTAEYHHWQDNLRAIALSMQALRAVDRYGVSKRGEQYRGWRQIPASTGDATSQITSREQAEEYLAQWDGDVKRAIRETHPDHGGDRDQFERVIRSRDLIGTP